MVQNPFKIEDDLFPKGNLDGKYRTNWVEESFDLEREQNKKLAIAHTRGYIGTSISVKKNIIMLLLISLGLGTILGRAIQLQIFNGNHYRSLAEGNRIRRIAIPAERGIIIDRFGIELVHNIPGFSLALVPQDLPHDPLNRSKLLSQVAQIANVPKDSLTALLTRYGSYSFESLPIKDNLNYNTALKLYIQNATLPGIEVKSGSERGYYTLDKTSSTKQIIPSLSHLLGYVGRLNDAEVEADVDKNYLPSDIIGKTGLEKQYEMYLRGTYGRKKIEVNAIGKEQSVLAVEPPIPGQDVELSIDLEAQKKLETLVKDTADKTGQKRIAAIAMDPNNGEVLALVSWPTFDNNKFVQGIDTATYQSYINDKDKPLFNRVISGLYPPGSTVKLVVSAAALQEKIITQFTSVNSVGGLQLGDRFFKDWKIGGHGITNVTKALAWSVNTFFYYVGGGYQNFVGLGVDRLVMYMRYFGMAAKTGIDLPNENTGFLPSRDWKKTTKGESWYVGDTYNLSIGQGDMLVTPLQVALWTAAVANDGILVTPHLGKKIIESDTKKETILKYPSHEITAVSKSNLAIVQQGMRDCVTYGSCKMLGSLHFSTAGKTGTAQWSNTHPTHAWFTSFAPYKNPQIIVTVLVEDGGEGASVTQPIALGFLNWWGKKYLP
jgi:penicillin-binding protein 2